MQPRLKKTYICKQVSNYQLQTDIADNYVPVDGDVAIFEVLRIGKHKTVQNHEKRNSTILPGDYIMAAFGTRYATAQFEGYLPASVHDELHILGAGGTVGCIASMHHKFSHVGPTKLRCVGLAVDAQGTVINTKAIAAAGMRRFSGAAAASTRVIFSVGSSMDSGKTTSAAYLVHGLTKAGHKAAYIKLTGTVYSKDADLALDLGACASIDFSMFGFPSTYMCPMNELLPLYESLLLQVLPHQPDFVVIEIADGLYERETSMLLQHAAFTDSAYGFMFSAGDSLAAINGIRVLNDWGIQPLFITGLLTASPLLMQETARHTELPIFNLAQLAQPDISAQIFARKLATQEVLSQVS